MPGDSPDDAFPIIWDDPADANSAWIFDPVHAPEPVPALSYDLNTGPFVKGFGWSRPILVNSYVYFEVRPIPEAVQRAAAAVVPGATRHLRDGQLIEVDGTAGDVRVVG